MLPDRMATHLVREDEVDEQDGALGQELVRMRAILDHLTAHSVVILNESFSTTAAAGAVRVGGDVLHRIVERGSVSVYVTFLDELAEVGPEVVGMVAGVEKDDAVRTFRIERRLPDDMAHAAVMVQRHGLTYDEIRARVR